RLEQYARNRRLDLSVVDVTAVSHARLKPSRLRSPAIGASFGEARRSAFAAKATRSVMSALSRLRYAREAGLCALVDDGQVAMDALFADDVGMRITGFPPLERRKLGLGA